MEVITPSRIHMGLIDLNASIGRIDGGFGLALEKPCIKIRARKSKELIVEGELKNRAADAAKKIISSLKIDSGAEIKVEEAFKQHIGLGSGTQLALAVGKSICSLYSENLAVREIAKVVGRGGTSGIGIAAFEYGGFIVDGGHSTREKNDFLPSSASRAPPPPVILRQNFPDWKIALVIPETDKNFSGGREVDIFKRYCPIDISEVRKLSHILLMGILPALNEEDVKTFGRCISEIQKIGFKKIEVNLQSRRLRELMQLCDEHSYGAGLSSFGPTIYCLVEDESELLGAIAHLNVRVIVTKANNHGIVIEE